jgi:hypothetical protein
MRKPKPKSAKPKGGQAGNKNAQKHGFYSKRFTVEERERLDASGTTDIQAEINLLRVCVDRLTQQLSFKEITRSDNNGTEFRDAHYLAQLNTLSAMTTSISTLIRTHYLTHGKSGGIQTSIQEALEIIRLEMGI